MLQSPIHISPKAAEEIRLIMQHKKIPEGYCLRVGAKGSGCAGTSYYLGFDKPKETDKSYSVEGIPVLMDKKHILYLIDIEVDFEEREKERGFVFNKKMETDPS